MKKTARSSILIVMVQLAVAVAADAQPVEKILRIGFLFGGSLSSNSARIEAFQQGLRELGYMEGKNVVVESRYLAGKQDRLSELATELASHLGLE